MSFVSVQLNVRQVGMDVILTNINDRKLLNQFWQSFDEEHLSKKQKLCF